MFHGRIFWHLGDAILDLVCLRISNARHRPCPWYGAFGHILAWRSGVAWARFWHLGDAILDLAFFESESNVRHQPCPWIGASRHLLAWRSGVVWARFLASWGRLFWTLFSTNQKATLGAGRVRGSGPSGTSWHLVLVFYGRIFSHLGDTILDLVFFESESNVRHQPCPWFGAFGHLLAWCSGVVEARFLASWGCHCGPCFLRIRKQR